MLLAVAIVIGILGGTLLGSTAGVVFMAQRGCLLPAEAVIDPFLGAMLGGWYGPVLIDAVCRSATGRRAFKLSGTLHLFFDTVCGLFVGHHFAFGLDTMGYELLHWGEFEVERVLAGFVLSIATGRFFYWSTSRWLRRMGHDGTGVERPMNLGLSHDC